MSADRAGLLAAEKDGAMPDTPAADAENQPPEGVSQWVWDQHTANMDRLRAEVAYRIWCYQEGYVKAEDRAIGTNWLLDDPATLHSDDAALRPHLLAMADEIIRLVMFGADR